MSASVFKIKEHTLESQHIREYPRATAFSQEEVLKLAIKQYIPLDNPNPQPGDVTIIGAHANGFPKELYEGLWDELHKEAKANGFRIRSIWIADAAHQGQSGILNEKLVGNDPSWMDHPRDILHMVNSFRSEMPLPIAGIGHSYGGNNLVNVSLMHPRLFSSLILLDPVMQGSGRRGDPSPNSEGGPARSSTWRRDLWPSREVAVAGFRKSPFYKAWDPRVLEAWVKFGIRDTPTLLYPNEKGSVTLTCTKHQELFTFLRPMYNDPANGPYENADLPDVDSTIPKDASFYRPEPNSTMHRLPHLRPPTLYIFGETSNMSTPELQAKKLDITGVGVGGSGGVFKGAVDSVTLKGIGHLVAMEAPSWCAGAAAPWIGKEVQKWAKEAERYREWTKQSDESKITISEEWKKHMGGDPRLKGKGKL